MDEIIKELSNHEFTCNSNQSLLDPKQLNSIRKLQSGPKPSPVLGSCAPGVTPNIIDCAHRGDWVTYAWAERCSGHYYNKCKEEEEEENGDEEESYDSEYYEECFPLLKEFVYSVDIKLDNIYTVDNEVTLKEFVDNYSNGSNGIDWNKVKTKGYHGFYITENILLKYKKEYKDHWLHDTKYSWLIRYLGYMSQIFVWDSDSISNVSLLFNIKERLATEHPNMMQREWEPVQFSKPPWYGYGM